MASSKEMELAIKIAGKVDSTFKSALSSVGSGIGALTKTITTATAAAAAAVGAIATAAVNVGKEFETSMSQVSATMLIDKTTEEGAAAYATLEEAARECGRSTAFSATEAAEALNYLALAGYDAKKAAAALPTVLNLAGAGAMDLAAASDMITDSMSALNIEATQDNLNNFADKMAMTASKANTSVSQLGDAILTVGATASNLAGGTTELNTALGILADNGIKGAEGGTHLRNVILSLQSPTDDAASALEKYTNGVYDAEGNMRSLQDIFADLSKSMEGMDQAAKDEIISTIFNKTDLTSANALLANCGDRWEELSGQIENCAGACEDMYNIQLDNLDGDIAKLQSGLSDLGISIYQDMNAPLREAAQLGIDMISQLSDAYASGGLEGMVGAVGDCLGQVVDVIAGYLPDVVSMAVSLIESFVNGIAENAGSIAEAAGGALTAFVNGLFVLIPDVILAGIDIIVALAESLAAQLPTLINNGTEAIQSFVQGLMQRIPEVAGAAIDLVQGLAEGIMQNAPSILTAAIELIGALADGLLSMLPEILQTAVQLIIALADGILSNIPTLIQTAVEIVTALLDGLLTNLPTLIQGAVQLVMALVQGIIAALPQIAQSAVQLIQTLTQSLVSNLPLILDTAIEMVMALIEGLVTMLPQLIEEGINLVISLAEGILQALPQILKAAVQLVTQLITGITSNLPKIIQQGLQLVVSLVTGIASNLPKIIQIAIQLIITLVQGIISAIPQLIACVPQIISAIVDTLFTTDWLGIGAQLLTGIINGIISCFPGLEGAIGNIVGFFSTAWENIKGVFSTVLEFFSGVWDTIVGVFTEIGTSISDAISGAVKGAINAVLGGAAGIINGFISAINCAIGVINAIPGVNISKLTPLEVPALAKGGIIEQPTLAMVGEGKQNEAVLPLDTLWTNMRSLLNEAIQRNSGGGGLIEGLVQKLQGIKAGEGNTSGEPALAGAGGGTFTYSPVYNLYGTATKEDVREADKLSQAEFARLMKQWKRENDRTKF